MYGGGIELEPLLELLRRYAPMGIARPERIAPLVVAREERSVAWKAAVQLDALVEWLSPEREPKILSEFGEQHWRFERSHLGLSFADWIESLRSALWTALHRSDAEAEHGAGGGDADGHVGNGTREPRRPIPSAGSAAVALKPPPPDEFTNAVADAA